MPLLHIYCTKITPRINYTLDFMIKKVWCSHYFLYDNIEKFTNAEGIKINYSSTTFDSSCISIFPCGLLEERGINFPIDKIVSHLKKSNFQSFQSQIDYFSIIFFMLSRYEEYGLFQADEHGRFSAASSAVQEHNFPFVDATLEVLRKQMNKIFPNLSISKPSSNFLATYDIDHARAYQWKGIKRWLGGLARSVLAGELEEIKERSRVTLGLQADPYDTFEMITKVNETSSSKPIFFWLLGKYGHWDKNPSPSHLRFREQIQAVSEMYEVGIHPSYGSYLNTEQLQYEIALLENITNKKIRKSRFHFLKFKLPDSYRMLLDVGITADYSMGYSDAIGYRAGTGFPFSWYDLEREVSTPLTIYPFQIMDVTLKDYLSLSPASAFDECQQIATYTQSFGGTCIHLWHNSSFDKRWKGWSSLHKEWVSLSGKSDN